jgi:hypothetical protein
VTRGDRCPRLVLVHSVFLGPSSWHPTAAALTAMGHAVEVPDLRPSLSREPCMASFIEAAQAVVAIAGSSGAVLAAHSRSGPMLPAMADSFRGTVEALIYVDSPLAYPGRSWVDEAPPGRAAGLRAKGVGRLLPRWSDWWDDPSVIEGLVPDPELRASFVADIPRVPVCFLDERLPDADWNGRAGYVQLSESYSGYAAAAQAAGWPVERRAVDHLAILTAPATVADGIRGLLELITTGA